MGMQKPPGLKLVDENLRRIDGRRLDELRPIKMKVGVLNRADGSAYVEWGKNKILVAVYGPRELHPRYMQDPTKAVVRARYNMAPFSTEERVKPGPTRRSVEISKLIAEMFSGIIFIEEFPRSAIDIFIEVLQADAGTRTAGITAASLALADAGIPMRGLVTACAAGKIDGYVALDLNKEEDNYGEADMPMAMLVKENRIVYWQMDGQMTEEEVRTAMKMVKDACEKIYEMQKEALKRKYIDLEGL